MSERDTGDPSASTTPQPEERPHQPADDREEVYFDGSPMLRGEIGRLLRWLVIAAILIAIPIVAWAAQYTVPWWATLILVAMALVSALVPIIAVRTVRYRISNYRIDYERGILSKTIDTLELWHVEDINFHQSLLDRILGVGTVTVISHDETTPALRLHSLPHPRPLFDSLKQRVIAVKRQRGVIKMDLG
jgi:membrane protein YdbS with pleckstrin-like domain